MQKHELVIEQVELLEMQIHAAAWYIRQLQERALFERCRLGVTGGCYICRIKRHLLRKRYK